MRVKKSSRWSPIGQGHKSFPKPGFFISCQNFRSHHNPQIKFGIIQCLTKCNIAIYSEHHKELNLLKNGLVANG